jgi:hypothetical protein
LNEVEDFFTELAPEHEGAVVDSWEFRENLSEAKISARRQQTIRIRMQASFNFMDFFTIEQEASRIKCRYNELMSMAGGNGRIISVTLTSFEMVAWLPSLSPEESLAGIKATIGSMRNCMAQEDTYELDWTDNYEGEEPIRMVQVRAIPEMVTYLKKLLEENSPFRYAGKEIRPILQGEDTGSQFYRDVMQCHRECTNERRVLCVDNIPLWFKPEKAIVTEAMYGGKVPQECFEWKLVDLLLSLRPSGMTHGMDGTVILQVLPGNTETSLSLTYAQGKEEEAWSLTERILQIISAAVGSAAAARLSIEAYPKIAMSGNDSAQNLIKLTGFEPTNEGMEEDEDSINQEDHITPLQRKRPPEELMPPMESRIVRLEEWADKVENALSTLNRLDTKIDKFSVSLTEMSTEVSDLRSTSSSLKGLIESSSSSSGSWLIGPRLRNELKETFTEAMVEANSKSSTNLSEQNIAEVERVMVDNCIPKLVSELKRADQEADRVWIKDHGEAFADKLAIQVASAVAIEVDSSLPNVEELTDGIRELRSIISLIREEVAHGGQIGVSGVIGTSRAVTLPTVQEENITYRPPTPTTPPEDQEFMTPHPGMADQASRGADMTIESAMEHHQRETQERIIEVEGHFADGDESIDPDVPVAVGEEVTTPDEPDDEDEEDGKMTPEQLQQYNEARENGSRAGVELLFDTEVTYPEMSNLSLSGVESQVRRQLARREDELRAEDIEEEETLVQANGRATATAPGAPVAERRVTRSVTAATRGGHEQDGQEPRQLNFDSQSTPHSEGRREENDEQPIPAERQRSRSASAERNKVQSQVTTFFKTA